MAGRDCGTVVIYPGYLFLHSLRWCQLRLHTLLWLTTRTLDGVYMGIVVIKASFDARRSFEYAFDTIA